MNRQLRQHADIIIKESIAAVLPDEAVHRAMRSFQPGSGRTILVSVGKAAWQMAHAALTEREVDEGIVITKYGHIKAPIAGVRCYEAGHPVPDGNSFLATGKVLEMTANLSAEDVVIFLLSGGGSALFELPLISGEELADITRQLLAVGADIVEVNTIRKRLSAVKGGRFAQHCAPAKVFSVVLSDIVGDPLDMIASGPAYADRSSCEQAVEIARRYNLQLSDEAWELLRRETPKQLNNVTTSLTGSVSELCRAAAESCRRLGYQPTILCDTMGGEAREMGRKLADVARRHVNSKEPLAYIAGGETVVHVTGRGSGGRNQELALAAAERISGLSAAIFSLGSDGTDGPTDAAGGYVDGDSAAALRDGGWNVADVLQENDAYHALKAVDGLIMTGPTGTNVNDVAVVLLP